MEENSTTPQNTTPNQKVQIPNSGGVLAMGILSLVCFCCIPSGLVGITLGILAIVFGNKALKLYHESPEKYTIKSYKNIKAGRVCGIIGLSIGGLSLVTLLIYLSAIGWAIGTLISTMPWDMM